MQLPFNADEALKRARAFHAAAGELKAAQTRLMARIQSGGGVRSESRRPGTVGTPLEADMLTRMVGAAAGEVVLETLALELVLKVRLARSGVAVWATHNHSKLFDKLPAPEKAAADQRYQSRRHSAMSKTLGEVLEFSADQFVKWRYMHEHPNVTARNSEMETAFIALVDGL